MDCSLPGSSVCGIIQARLLEWVAIPFSRGSSWLRDQTWVSHIAGRFFTVWATREVPGVPYSRYGNISVGLYNLECLLFKGPVRVSWLFYFASSSVLSGAGSSHLEDRGVRQRKWENNCLFWYFPCWVLLFSLSIQIYYTVPFKNFSFSPSAFYHVWNICLPMINTSVYVLNHLDNFGGKIDGWPLPKTNSESLGVGLGHPWFSKVPQLSYLVLY